MKAEPRNNLVLVGGVEPAVLQWCLQKREVCRVVVVVYHHGTRVVVVYQHGRTGQDVQLCHFSEGRRAL